MPGKGFDKLGRPIAPPRGPDKKPRKVTVTPARTAASQAAVAGIAESRRKQAVLRELARRELVRQDFLYFVRQTYPLYQAGWVHKDICARLERFSQQVVDKKRPRLMLLVPPRHGKSELASIRFPAWHLGRNPTHEVVDAGYNLDLPMKFSRQARDLFKDPTFAAVFPDAVINESSQSIENWLTTKNGGYTAVGVGGGLTGKGAHILIVDDPIKNQQDADSVLIRDQLWDWYMSTARTRLAPGGGVLIVQTWWNDDDLAGRVQQLAAFDSKADQFEIVKYPAIAETDEYRHPETLDVYRGTTPPAGYELLRKEGEALHPERYPIDELLTTKATLSKRIWSALYQQNPVPDEGAYFMKDQFRFQKTLPAATDLNVYSAWDFAIGEKQSSDYTVGTTGIQDVNDVLYLVDTQRGRWDAGSIIEEIINMAERWMNLGASYVCGFEDGQVFKAIFPALTRRMQDRKVFFAYEILKPLTDKMARGRALQARMQSNRMVFPDEAPWLNVVRQEMLRFPAGAHDDCVDSLAWLAQLVIRHQPPSPPKAAEVKSWKDKLSVSGVGSHMSA